MADPKIAVKILGDASGFSKSVDGAISKTESITAKLQTVGKGMVIGAGIGAFNLLQGAIGGMVGSLEDAAAAYREDQAGQATLANALKNNIPNWDGNTKAAEDYAAAQGKLGFVDDQVRESLGQLIGITHDLTKAEKLNSIAQDLARAKHIDLAAAVDAVTKAAQGNGKALKSMGIDIAGAKGEAQILDRIQRNVAGSAALWAQTNEGKLAVSNVKVGEAMERVGKIVDRLAQAVLPALADGLETVVGLLMAVEEHSGTLMGALRFLATGGMSVAQDSAQAMADELIRVEEKTRAEDAALKRLADTIVARLSPSFYDGADAAYRLSGAELDAETSAVNLRRAMGHVGDAAAGASSKVKILNGLFQTQKNRIGGAIDALDRYGQKLRELFGLDPMSGLYLTATPDKGETPPQMGGGSKSIIPGRASGAGRTPGGVNVVVQGSVYGVSGIDELTGMIAARMRLQGAA